MKFQILNFQYLIHEETTNKKATPTAHINMEIITRKSPLPLSTILCIHCAFKVSLKTLLSALWCLISLETSISLHKQVYFYEPVFQLKSEFIGNRLSKFGSIEKLLWKATRSGEENTSQTVNRTPL